jgi:hypothetical protein
MSEQDRFQERTVADGPDVDVLLRLEQGFWLEGAEFYREHLARKSMMVFPDPIGVMTRAQIIAGVQEGPRWTRVSMEDARLLDIGNGCLVLTYKALARRERLEFSYSVLAGSVYVREGDAWKLAFHQHTPSLASG